MTKVSLMLVSVDRAASLDAFIAIRRQLHDGYRARVLLYGVRLQAERSAQIDELVPIIDARVPDAIIICDPHTVTDRTARNEERCIPQDLVLGMLGKTKRPAPVMFLSVREGAVAWTGCEELRLADVDALIQRVTPPAS